MIGFEVTIDDKQIAAAIKRFMHFGGNSGEMMRDIATLGENTTRERFRTETAPDGSKWKPSLRAQLHGGKTLTLDGHLSGSVSSQSGAGFAEWGVNRIYAAIHQFGGTIKAKTDKGLRFKTPGGGFATKKEVSIPARPYLGVSARDEGEILDIIARHIKGQLA